MREAADKDGWIQLEMIYNFPKLKKFHSVLSMMDLFEVLKLSTVIEVGIMDKFGDEEELDLYIRKKHLIVNAKYKDFFGFDVETIK